MTKCYLIVSILTSKIHLLGPTKRQPKGARAMRRVMVFNNISLDGYFTDANNDMSWAHQNADEGVE